MSQSFTPRVAVSYSWKEEREGSNKGAVESFCKVLADSGINVIRDSERLKHGQCISNYMRDIGASDFLCIFLSDNYLRSPNCMYELLVAWQRSKDNADEFRERVKIWMMPGAPSIQEPESRQEYRVYWQTERDRFAPIVQTSPTDGLAPAEVNSFQQIQQLAFQVNAMLCFIADTLLPQSMDEFAAWVRTEFGVAPKIDETLLAATYEQTAREIDQLLAHDKRLADFLFKACPTVFRKSGELLVLSEAIRKGEVNICDILEQIKVNLTGFSGPAGDWERLQQVVGGFMTFAVNREWVLKQRSSAEKHGIQFPGKQESIPFMHQQGALLLPLLTGALSDGFVRLERVFGVTNNRQLTTEPPEVVKGILAHDKLKAMKLHFIHYVLNPEDFFDHSNEEVDWHFEMTRKAMEYAATKKRDPYFTSDKKYQKLAEMIRTDLNLQHLLLIFPDGQLGSEALFTDTVFLFSHAFEIFQTIEKNLKSK